MTESDTTHFGFKNKYIIMIFMIIIGIHREREKGYGKGDEAGALGSGLGDELLGTLEAGSLVVPHEHLQTRKRELPPLLGHLLFLVMCFRNNLKTLNWEIPVSDPEHGDVQHL